MHSNFNDHSPNPSTFPQILVKFQSNCPLNVPASFFLPVPHDTVYRINLCTDELPFGVHHPNSGWQSSSRAVSIALCQVNSKTRSLPWYTIHIEASWIFLSVFSVLARVTLKVTICRCQLRLSLHLWPAGAAHQTVSEVITNSSSFLGAGPEIVGHSILLADGQADYQSAALLAR